MRAHPGGQQQEVSLATTRRKGRTHFYICWLFTGEAESLSRCCKNGTVAAAWHRFHFPPPTQEKQGTSPHSDKPSAPLFPASVFPALHVFSITSDRQGALVCFPCHRPDVRRPRFPWPCAPRLYLSGPGRLVGTHLISASADRLFHSCCFHLD